MIVQLLGLAAASPIALEWSVKEGCQSNDSVIASHLFLPAQHPLSCSARQYVWGVGAVYAWGQCNGSLVQMGFAHSLLECLDSIKAKDGFHREVIFQEKLKEGDCKCTPRESYVNAFHCIKTEFIEGARMKTSHKYPQLILSIKENAPVYNTSFNHTDFAINHTYDDDVIAISWFFPFFLLLIVSIIFLTMM